MTMLLPAMAVVREKEIGTLEQLMRDARCGPGSCWSASWRRSPLIGTLAGDLVDRRR